MPAQLRKTHPNRYGALMVVAVGTIALGLNFLFLHPSFNPLNIPKGPTGAVFLVAGVAHVLLLNVPYLLPRRIAMTANLALFFFWAIALAVAFRTMHQTSLQLPIVYLIVVGVTYFWVKEPYINPVTDKSGNGNGGKQ